MSFGYDVSNKNLFLYHFDNIYNTITSNNTFSNLKYLSRSRNMQMSVPLRLSVALFTPAIY